MASCPEENLPCAVPNGLEEILEELSTKVHPHTKFMIPDLDLLWEVREFLDFRSFLSNLKISTLASQLTVNVEWPV